MKVFVGIALSLSAFAVYGADERGTKLCQNTFVLEGWRMTHDGMVPMGQNKNMCITIGPASIVRLPKENSPPSFTPPPLGAVSRSIVVGNDFLAAPPSDAAPRYQIPGSYSHFAATFLTSIFQNEVAQIDNNKSVDKNLDAIRRAVGQNSMKLEKDYTNSKQSSLSLQSATIANLGLSHKQAIGVVPNLRPGQIDLLQRLEGVDSGPADPADLAKLPRQSLSKAEAQAALEQYLKGIKPVGVTSFGSNSTNIRTIQDSDMLVAAIDSQLSIIDSLPPSLERDMVAVAEAKLALALAKRMASKSIETANLLFAEASSASRMATRESPSRVVAIYRGEAGANVVFIDWKDAPKEDRILTQVRAMFVMVDGIRIWVKNNSKVLQSPRDTLIDVTEKLADQAEDYFSVSRRKSLGGLFRARSLVENATLFGGVYVSLKSWANGATRKISDLLNVRRSERENIINASKDLLKNVVKLKEIVDTSDNPDTAELIKVFSEDHISDLTQKIKLANNELLKDSVPTLPFAQLAPPVRYWLDEDFRLANVNNADLQIAELLRLRSAYESQLELVNEGSLRMVAMSQLAEKLSRIAVDEKMLKLLIAVELGISTLPAAKSIANSKSLEQLQNETDEYRDSLDRSKASLQAEIEKVNKLLQAWMLARPDRGLFRAIFSPALQTTP